MQEKTKLQKVIDVLKEKGYSDDQIVEFTTNLTKASFAKFYSEAMLSFTEEDMKTIDECESEKAANDEIRWRYRLRTGKNVDEEALKFVDTFAEGFLQEYEKEKLEASSTNKSS